MTDLTLETTATSAEAGSTATWHDFVALLKPRVMTLVVFSAFAGLLAAPGALHPVLAATAILCVAVAAGGAAAINMWYDRDIDLVMARTRQRPIPGGRMRPEAALAFGVVLSGAAAGMMGLAVNWTAAAVLALSVLFYVFVYTVWLKRRTPQNIVIGGAAGAFPPVIGWAAVTGDIGLGALALFALIFMWTPPHFWALALYRNDDYARAGVPMLPVVAGERHTKLQMLVYTVLLLPLAVLPYWIGIAGPVYGAGAATLGLLFLACALKVWREDGAATGHRAARLMFGYSIFYLFAVFGLLIVDRTA
ncbi:MAG: protoheme IX farnesyltransferase [Inquilinus sp.]|nr:protoheme IX farnesyltransferase [Inquilinus sp.]